MNRSDVERMIDSKISDMENRLDAKINAMISRMRNEFNANNATGGGRKNNEENDRQLAIVAKQNAEIAVRNVMDKEFMPMFKAFADDIKEKTMDGGELITQYRKRVMGGDQQRMITSGNKRADFQRSVFVFTDDD